MMRKYALAMMFLVAMFLLSAFFALRPVVYSSAFSSSETLLGAGALWAANNGTRAAYVDLYDNVVAYPNPYMSANSYLPLKNEVVSVLEGEGFTVDTFANIPANLSQYNLVYLEAYFACEPANEPAIRSYISSGGGVLMWQGSICYLAYYSKTMNTGQDLSGVADWFGASYYVNTGGDAYVNVPYPLGTNLTGGEQLVTGLGYSCAGIQSMSTDSQVLATWFDGSAYAFTHQYGEGRVYWQATQQSETPPPPQPGGSNKALALMVYGGFDYGLTEQAKVKVFAELRDRDTMEPVSGANVTMQVFDPNDTLWISANMIETTNGTGIYEWASLDTIANMNLQMGVYLTRVTAANGGLSASEIILFHIDPPANSIGTATNQWYLVTIITLMLGGILAVSMLVKKTLTGRRERPI